MPSSKLPAELWDHILFFCDHPSECALSKVCQRLANIVTEKNQFALEKCRRKGVKVPSDAIMDLSLKTADLPLDPTLLEVHNPFGCPLFPRPSTVRGFEVEEKEGKTAFTTIWSEAGVMERGTTEFTVDYESIGIPRWIIDGLRPTIRVSALLQRRDYSTAGKRVAGCMGVWRLDGISKDKTPMSKETVQVDICTVENGISERSFEVVLEPSSTIHGHPSVGGSDGLLIVVNSSSDVRISEVKISFELPDEIPAQFTEWLDESREIRKLRSTKVIKSWCQDIGLFGL